MTYTDSFLDTADAEGNVPNWALTQIFEDHCSSLDDYTGSTPVPLWFNAEVILEWLGY